MTRAKGGNDAAEIGGTLPERPSPLISPTAPRYRSIGAPTMEPYSVHEPS